MRNTRRQKKTGEGERRLDGNNLFVVEFILY
jgi:hypothetical protein